MKALRWIYKAVFMYGLLCLFLVGLKVCWPDYYTVDRMHYLVRCAEGEIGIHYINLEGNRRAQERFCKQLVSLPDENGSEELRQEIRYLQTQEQGLLKNIGEARKIQLEAQAKEFVAWIVSL